LTRGEAVREDKLTVLSHILTVLSHILTVLSLESALSCWQSFIEYQYVRAL